MKVTTTTTTVTDPFGGKTVTETIVHERASDRLLQWDKDWSIIWADEHNDRTGGNDAIAYLFQRSPVKPKLPTAQTKYSFNEGQCVGLEEWKPYPPTGTMPLWITAARVVTTHDYTDPRRIAVLVSPSAWSRPIPLASK